MSDDPDVLYHELNPKLDSISFGYVDGFSIFSVDPFNLFREVFRKRLLRSYLRLVEMTHTSDVVALVGTGKNQTYPTNKVQLWSLGKNKLIGDIEIPSPVVSVGFSRKKIIVVAKESVFLFNTTHLTLSGKYATVENSIGLGTVMTHKTTTIVAIPHAHRGSIRVMLIGDDNSSQDLVIQAHVNELTHLVLATNGTMVVSCGRNDACIRIWDNRTGAPLRKLKLTGYCGEVTGLSFNKNSSVLAALYGGIGAIDVFLLEESSRLRHRPVEVDCMVELGLSGPPNHFFWGLFATEADFAEAPYAEIRGLPQVSLMSSSVSNKLMCTFITRSSKDLLVAFAPNHTVVEYDFARGNFAVSSKHIDIHSFCPLGPDDPPEEEDLGFDREADHAAAASERGVERGHSGRSSGGKGGDGGDVDDNASDSGSVRSYGSRGSRRSAKASGSGKQIKMLLVGDSAVGKTSVLHQFATGKFHERVKTTTAVDFKFKKIEVPLANGQLIDASAAVWDSPGNGFITSKHRTFYAHANAILLVFDVTRITTYKNIARWLVEFERNDYVTNKQIPMVLMANKIDLISERRPREVSTDEASDWAAENGLNYIEMSATDNEQINAIFMDIIRSLV